MKKRRILICGNYGAGNFGDELILMGLLKIIKKLPNIEITVMTGNEKETWTSYNVQVAPFVPSSIKSWTKNILKGKAARALFAIGQADLIIFGGGGLFNEKEEKSMKIWNSQVKAFRFFKKPVIMIGQSFGAIEKEKNKKIIRHVCESMKKIFVRDHTSKKNLETLGIERNIQVISDPAFWLDPSDFSEDARQEKNSVKQENFLKNYWIMNLRSWAGVDENHICEVVNSLISQLPGTPIFVPMQKEDEKIFHRLRNGKRGDSRLTLVQPKNLGNLWSLFAHADSVFSMRLHAGILATIMQKPLIAITYDEKVKNLLTQENPDAILLDPGINSIIPPDTLEKINAFFSASNPPLKATSRKADQNIFQKILTKNIKSI